MTIGRVFRITSHEAFIVGGDLALSSSTRCGFPLPIYGYGGESTAFSSRIPWKTSLMIIWGDGNESVIIISSSLTSFSRPSCWLSAKESHHLWSSHKFNMYTFRWVSHPTTTQVSHMNNAIQLQSIKLTAGSSDDVYCNLIFFSRRSAGCSLSASLFITDVFMYSHIIWKGKTRSVTSGYICRIPRIAQACSLLSF